MSTETQTPPKYSFIGSAHTTNQETKCGRCGYPITHFYTVIENTTAEKMIVGSECVKILTGKTIAENIRAIKDAAKQAEEEERERVRKLTIEEFRKAHDAEFRRFVEVVSFLRQNKVQNDFIENLVEYFNKFETLTEKQLQAVWNNFTQEKCDQLVALEGQRQKIGKMLKDLSLCNLGRFDKDFFKSLMDQYYAKDFLSEKQIAALEKMTKRYTKQIAGLYATLGTCPTCNKPVIKAEPYDYINETQTYVHTINGCNMAYLKKMFDVIAKKDIQ